MLKLNKQVEYGLIALLHMDAVGDAELVTAKHVAEIFKMPTDLVGKILQKLVRAGLLESAQGSYGGYRLRIPLAQMKLGQVLEALEGPMHLVRCDKDPGQCSQFDVCNIKRAASRIQQDLAEYIQDIPLSSFRGDSTTVSRHEKLAHAGMN